jgi:hypothetical protein
MACADIRVGAEVIGVTEHDEMFFGFPNAQTIVACWILFHHFEQGFITGEIRCRPVEA